MFTKYVTPQNQPSPFTSFRYQSGFQTVCIACVAPQSRFMRDYFWLIDVTVSQCTPHAGFSLPRFAILQHSPIVAIPDAGGNP